MQHLPSTLCLCGRILRAAVPRRPVLLVPAAVMLVADAGLRLAGVVPDTAFVLAFAIGMAVGTAGRMRLQAKGARAGHLHLVVGFWILAISLLVWFGTPAACLHLITAISLAWALLWALDLGKGPREMVARLGAEIAEGPLAPLIPRVMLLTNLTLALAVQTAMIALPQPYWLLMAGLMSVVSLTLHNAAMMSLSLVVEGR